MKKYIITTIVLLCGLAQIKAQDKFFTKTGKITFDATVPASPEKISGINKSSIAVLDTKTGNMQFSVMMKGFLFERALMEEHFNENYVESNKFPKSEFKGQVVDNSKLDYSKEGSYNVTVKGKLTIHGETREVEAKGVIKVAKGGIGLSSTFKVPLADYKISIPSIVADKLATQASIIVDCQLEPLKQ